jgi:hypothetical protein
MGAIDEVLPAAMVDCLQVRSNMAELSVSVVPTLNATIRKP